jgi:CheY-like chemotaxis protein
VNPRHKPIVVLLAEDDPDDRLLLKEALSESRLVTQLACVEDGEELMDYLYLRGKYALPAVSPRPHLILLDLNMPRKNGREAISEIKADPELRRIPIVVLTTSKAPEDIRRSYDGGANSYITKPVTFESLAGVMETISRYWFDTVELPPLEGGAGGGHSQNNGVGDVYGQWC